MADAENARALQASDPVVAATLPFLVLRTLAAGESGGIRTRGHALKRRMLYH